MCSITLHFKHVYKNIWILVLDNIQWKKDNVGVSRDVKQCCRYSVQSIMKFDLLQRKNNSLRAFCHIALSYRKIYFYHFKTLCARIFSNIISCKCCNHIIILVNTLFPRHGLLWHYFFATATSSQEIK